MDEEYMRAWRNEIYDYVRAADRREADADRRNAALLRVHEQGWKLAADAVRVGLRDIAQAISAGLGRVADATRDRVH